METVGSSPRAWISSISSSESGMAGCVRVVRRRRWARSRDAKMGRKGLDIRNRDAEYKTMWKKGGKGQDRHPHPCWFYRSAVANHRTIAPIGNGTTEPLPRDGSLRGWRLVHGSSGVCGLAR
eukprot:scaffold57437_cov33-Tisochrysis_lutea.AAC.1